ncbi:cytochrome c peroxidase [Paraburkholderia tropica]|uniref:cytochrome c peroxidase n=1 Tax=Paraburkholderia tropica TaxID=92647 RepID=UPI0016149E9E|nr:cytochrome c peroxidase [Paraburkholderia tropica]MBB3004295.1 cytochrome c peroxidase [Paraburkholderia tropica]MBB6317856.1 cytochrome c peroxidase [Paraburkholderia tropica]
MNKFFVSVAGLLAAGYLGLSALAWYHDTTYAEGAAARPAASPEAARIRDILDRNACYSCHSTKAVLPPYASLPGIKQIAQFDTERGQRYFRLDTLYAALHDGAKPGEADLAKLERVAQNDTMPPARFRAVHWGTGLSAGDRHTLLDWIAHERKRWYATPGVAAAFENDAVQPLPHTLRVDPRKVALGMRLFHDPRLSADNTISCASCHALGTGGVDNRKLSLGVGGQLGSVNAPTVFNAALNHAQFWDGRAATLQEQAGGPPLNPVEMASVSWEQIVGKLQADPALVETFAQIYPDGISGPAITDAIAEFEKTLLTPSRVDAYLRGDARALNSDEAHGYQLFKSMGCATCHVGANLGGQSFERMGRAGDWFAARGGALTEADNGRANVTRDPHDVQAFKVPGLRNVALTAPYFHDGSVNDLREAVKQMAQYQLGTAPSDADVDALVAFLNALSGTYTPSPALAAQP